MILWDKFIGHPQLKRILNMDEMTFPMRKEFQWKIAEE
jgi:NADH:ubiquinone oxidoreductase subunit C